MIPRKPLGCLAVACLLLFAGCTSGLSLSDGVEGSAVVDDVDLTVARNNTVTLAVTYAPTPTISEEDCWFNPATKTTQCNHDYFDVNVTHSQLVLSTDPEASDDDRTVEPVERNGQTVVFEYDAGSVTEVTVKSEVVGAEDDYKWGATSFGFEVDPASRDYLVGNTTWYDEEF